MTRLLFDRFKAPWVYARYDGGEGGGPTPFLPPELPSFAELTTLHRAGPCLPTPEVAYAVVGDRAHESIGPRVFNRVFRARGVQAQYAPLTTTSLAGVREACRLFGVRGLSVTTPFKDAALDLADDVHPRAATLGAANTLVKEGGSWTAYNTDVDGVAVPVKAAFAARGRPTDGARAVVVGLGGFGRAAAWALRGLGFRTRCAVRRRELVGTSPLGVGVDVVATDDVGAASADLVVNATPCGSARDPAGRAVDLAWLAPGGVVVESNYRPRATALIVEARARGYDVVDGVAVYAAQAIAQLRLFRADLDDAEALLAAEADAAAKDA